MVGELGTTEEEVDDGEKPKPETQQIDDECSKKAETQQVDGECSKKAEGKVSDSDDDDEYDPVDDDEDASSVASLDHLSEGEDELVEVRRGNPIAKIPTRSELTQFNDVHWMRSIRI